MLTSAKITSGISRFKRNQFPKKKIMIANIFAAYLESFKCCLIFWQMLTNAVFRIEINKYFFDLNFKVLESRYSNPECDRGAMTLCVVCEVPGPR